MGMGMGMSGGMNYGGGGGASGYGNNNYGVRRHCDDFGRRCWLYAQVSLGI